MSADFSGSDGFMSVIKPISDDCNIAMVYVTPAGIIVSMGRGFNNLFGHDVAEHIGKPLRSICKDPEEFNKLLSSAVASTSTSGLVKAASGLQGQDIGNLTIMHKFGDEITVHVKTMKVSSRTVHHSLLWIITAQEGQDMSFTYLVHHEPACAIIIINNIVSICII